jgi:hypothetical protein
MKAILNLLFIGLATAAHGQARPPVDGAQLLAELKKGGHILYFRHTATLPEHQHEANQRQAGSFDIANCATQRNLSELGYVQARTQAQWVVKLGIPMGEVLASRYCRTKIHAAFFTDTPKFSEPLTPVRNPEKAAELKRMLAVAPAPGSNTFMFAHGGILWQATDYDSVEAELFVFKPGTGYVASLRMEDWALLAAGKPCCAPRNFWKGKAPIE